MDIRPSWTPATLASTLACLLPTGAEAAGLYVPDLGVMPQGRGGAYVAKADSSLGLHYNPAGLFQVDGFQVEGGIMAHKMDTWFLRAGGEGKWKTGAAYANGLLDPDDKVLAEPFGATENQDSFRPIPEFSLMYGLKKPDITFALGFYAPDAPWLAYPDDSPGRYRMLKARLDQATWSLGASWRPVPWLAVGAALQLVAFRISEEFDISAHLFPDEDSNNEDQQFDLRVRFDALQFPAPNGNFGLMLIPNDRLQIGVSFQTGLHMKAPGTVTIDGDLSSELLGYFGQFTGDTTSIHVQGHDPEILLETDLPPILRAGLLVRPHPRIEIELDGVVEFWSVHDGIVASQIDTSLTGGEEGQPLPDYVSSRGLCGFIQETDGTNDCSEIPAVYEGTDGQGNFEIREEFQDAVSVRLGFEANPVDPLVVRAGYLLETSAIPDEWLGLAAIDSLKHAVGVGAALRLPGFEIGGTWYHVFYGERAISPEVSQGTQSTAFASTPPNRIDAGTYRASVDNIGLYLRVNPGAIAASRKARKGGGDPL